VHERLWARLSSTEGNCVRALTLGSQACWSIASASAVPVRFLFCASQLSAYETWSGLVAAAKTCATRASGYRAMGATSASNCSADSGAGAGAELPLGVVVETVAGCGTYSGCPAY